MPTFPISSSVLVLTVLVSAGAFVTQGRAQDAAAEASLALPRPSPEVAQVTQWVVGSGDNNGAPFLIVDKASAMVFVHEPDGRLLGATPALLGTAQGDDSVPGIGDRELRKIPPEERTTPAGRFVASFGPAKGKKTVLWVDFSTALSLHPVVNTNRKERRPERLQSPEVDDNRISYGCINVATDFYQNVIEIALSGGRGVVYILPETKALEAVFPGLGTFAGFNPGRMTLAEQSGS